MTRYEHMYFLQHCMPNLLKIYQSNSCHFIAFPPLCLSNALVKRKAHWIWKRHWTNFLHLGWPEVTNICTIIKYRWYIRQLWHFISSYLRHSAVTTCSELTQTATVIKSVLLITINHFTFVLMTNLRVCVQQW